MQLVGIALIVMLVSGTTSIPLAEEESRPNSYVYLNYIVRTDITPAALNELQRSFSAHAGMAYSLHRDPLFANNITRYRKQWMLA